MIRVSSVGYECDGRMSHQIFEVFSMMPRSTSTLTERWYSAQLE